MQQLRKWPCREIASGEYLPYDPRVRPYGRQIVFGETPQEGDFYVNSEGEVVKLCEEDNNFHFTSDHMAEGRYFRSLFHDPQQPAVVGEVPLQQPQIRNLVLDNTLVKKLRDLAVEAADALWALANGKNPDRDPILINQDIHRLRPRIDAFLQEPPENGQKKGEFVWDT